MKRLLAFFLAFITVAVCVSPTVFAQTAVDTSGAESSYESLGAGAVTFSCAYSSDAKRLEVNGNVNYNVLVAYGKYSIGILRIPLTQSIEEAILSESPDIAARMDIAAKFAFSIELRNAVDRSSSYAAVLISPDEELVLASSPQLVNVASTYAHSSSDRSAFKGIMPQSTAEVSESGDLGYGSAIIPVYYDRLINESMNGYMYPHEDTHCFFDKTYIDELDMRVRTYSATGARVYLQLLLPSASNGSVLLGTGGEKAGAEYDMPDIYDTNTLSKIYTYVRFLVSRYKEYTDGQISGIIVGKQIDVQRYNYIGGLSVEDYAKKYAYYLTAVANTARLEDPKLDVVVPFSDRNTYSSSLSLPNGDYSSSELSKEIAAFLDGKMRSKFSYSTMLESSSVPLGASSEDENGRFLPTAGEGGIGVNELSVYDAFLSKLRTSYKSVPDSYIYFWQIPETLYGTLLECSYAYSYYTLLTNGRLSSFVVSFKCAQDGAAQSIRRTVAAIDTQDGTRECQRLLTYFGASSWADVVRGYSEKSAVLRDTYISSENVASSREWLGSFTYFDFSTGDVNGWYGAAYTSGLRLDYGDGGKRVLRQTVQKATGGAHSDLFCLYEYAERLANTPAVAFDLKITDGEPSSGAVYEITVTVGTNGSSVSQKRLVRAGELCRLWLDVGEYGKNNKASYVKISTRSVSGDAAEYSLWVYDAIGYSDLYDDETLSTLINADRQSVREQSTTDGGNSYSIIYWIVFSIILAAILIGGVIIIVARRDDRGAWSGRNKK